MKNKLKNSPIITTQKILVFVTALCSFMSTHAMNANFSLKAQYVRNKKIWGTYKLSEEKLSIIRGKKKWFKTPTSRVGDIIISNGHITFVRETKENGKTKIVVDKIPYKKKGKGIFVNREPLEKEVMDRLYRPDLKSITPHLDLIKGTIQYNELRCAKNKRNRKLIDCTIQGEMLPQA